MYIKAVWLTTATCLLFTFLTTHHTTAQDTDEKKVEEALRLMEQLSHTRKGLQALKKIVNDIDKDMQTTQKRSCYIGGGMSGHCAAAFLNNRLDMHDWLQSGMSPGKKRAIQTNNVDKPKRLQQRRKRFDPCAIGVGSHAYDCYMSGLGGRKTGWLSKSIYSPGKRSEEVVPERTFEDLARKRKGLEILQRILEEMEADIGNEQKRTCQFNLGGHCATESAAYVADHWHYLNSPLSPGRKRRDTRLFKNLINGQLFQ